MQIDVQTELLTNCRFKSPFSKFYQWYMRLDNLQIKSSKNCKVNPNFKQKCNPKKFFYFDGLLST